MQDWKMMDKSAGLENAGQENDKQRNFRGWKLQDWNMTDESAGVENAGLENDGQKCRAGKYRTGN